MHICMPFHGRVDFEGIVSTSEDSPTATLTGANFGQAQTSTTVSEMNQTSM